MASRWESVVVDCQDPARLARWWGEVLGYKIVAEQDEYVAIGAGDNHPSLAFLPVTEHKTVKNRLHIDLTPDDQAAEVERLIDMGARHIDIEQSEQPWVVLADPEGNEFRVLTASDK